jgi:hypothetical protein
MGGEHSDELPVRSPHRGGAVEEAQRLPRGRALQELGRMDIPHEGLLAARAKIVAAGDVRPLQGAGAGHRDMSVRVEQADDRVGRVVACIRSIRARLVAVSARGPRRLSEDAAIWMSRRRSNMPRSRLRAIWAAGASDRA